MIKPKEIRFQNVSELSKADVYVSQFRRQIVPDSGSGNKKSLSPKLFCVRGTAAQRMFCTVVTKETLSAVV